MRWAYRGSFQPERQFGAFRNPDTDLAVLFEKGINFCRKNDDISYN